MGPYPSAQGRLAQGRQQAPTRVGQAAVLMLVRYLTSKYDTSRANSFDSRDFLSFSLFSFISFSFSFFRTSLPLPYLRGGMREGDDLWAKLWRCRRRHRRSFTGLSVSARESVLRVL
ncbi:hypothetical protein SEVIR_5G048501v4 [Setaria viridis]